MARTTTKQTTPGVLYRHSRECTNHECGNRCSDSPAPWEAWVYDAKYVDATTGRRGKKVRRRFATHAAAKGWRADASGQVRRRELQAIDRATAQRTLRQEVDEWVKGAGSGAILNKRKEQYKPGVVREYERSLRLRVLPVLGDRRLDSIALRDLLGLQEDLQGAGCSPSVIRNTFVPVQAILRRARRRGVITANPAVDLELPTAGSRERAATPEQAVELLATLAEREAAIWATAFYAGLRRGEIRALRVSDVDLDAATVTVERGWDDKEGLISPKSRAGRRTVFVLDVLRPYLEPLVEGRDDDELVFGKSGAEPFDARAVLRKAERAWKADDEARSKAAEEAGSKAAEEAGDEDLPVLLERFGLHEARHSFSTWMDHAGISESRADRYMGHSSGGVAQRYRHLLPEQIAEDRLRLDAYLAGAPADVVRLRAAG